MPAKWEQSLRRCYHSTLHIYTHAHTHLIFELQSGLELDYDVVIISQTASLRLVLTNSAVLAYSTSATNKLQPTNRMHEYAEIAFGKV